MVMDEDAAKKEATYKSIQLSFVKDVLAGAITLLLFTSFGWPQWYLVAFHVASVPGALTLVKEGSFITFCLVATLLSSFADVVTILTLTCGIVRCCAPGESSPAFFPMIKACDSASAGAQGRVISVTAIVSIGVGLVMSASRAILLEEAVGKTDWIALCVVYVTMRVYQLAWTGHAGIVGPAVECGITLGLVAFVAFTEWRRNEDSAPRKRSGTILYGVAVADAVFVAAPLIYKPLVPVEVAPAFYIMQSATALAAGWQAHRLYSAKEAVDLVQAAADDVPTGGDDKPPSAQTSTISVGAHSIRARRGRTMCL